MASHARDLAVALESLLMRPADPDARRAADAALVAYRRDADGAAQIPLFSARREAPARPYSDTGTSLQAAAKLDPGRAKSQRSKILRLIRMSPRTDHDLAESMGIDGNTIRPRRWELVHRGWIRDSGVTDVLPTGRRGTLWEITPDGEAQIIAEDREARQ